MQPKLVAFFVAEFTADGIKHPPLASSELDGERRGSAAVEPQPAGQLAMRSMPISTLLYGTRRGARASTSASTVSETFIGSVDDVRARHGGARLHVKRAEAPFHAASHDDRLREPYRNQ